MCVGDEFSHAVSEVAARAVRVVLVLGGGFQVARKACSLGVLILRDVFFEQGYTHTLSLSPLLGIWFKVCGNNADAVQVGLKRWGRSSPAHQRIARMQLPLPGPSSGTLV